MGFIFSDVRVSTDTDEISFLVDGTPKEYADLEKWRVFEFFLQEAGKETNIQVHVDTYRYGWKRTPANASPSELELISDFMKADRDECVFSFLMSTVCDSFWPSLSAL